MRRLRKVLLGFFLLALAAPGVASASALLARDARDVKLAVDNKGSALISHTLPTGKRVNALVWGAVNARHPDPTTPQVAFKIDYSGGWGTYRKMVWRTFKNRCQPYDGPPVAMLVTACKAPDGSYWALQSWQRALPIFGREPRSALEKAWELHLSHWNGDIAVLEVYQDWKYSVRVNNIFGRYLYQGVPVYGFKVTRAGAPLDGYARNVYFDSLDSVYGPGWRRTNGLLSHNPTGVFCEAIGGMDFLPDNPIANHGRAGRYRVTAVGPGVTPDVTWDGEGLPVWDPGNGQLAAHEQAMNDLMASFGDRDPRCTEP